MFDMHGRRYEQFATLFFQFPSKINYSERLLSYRRGADEESSSVGCDTVSIGQKLPIFRDKTCCLRLRGLCSLRRVANIPFFGSAPLAQTAKTLKVEAVIFSDRNDLQKCIASQPKRYKSPNILYLIRKVNYDFAVTVSTQ